VTYTIKGFSKVNICHMGRPTISQWQSDIII